MKNEAKKYFLKNKITENATNKDFLEIMQPFFHWKRFSLYSEIYS